MFQKKYTPQTNYDSMFGAEILRSLERIEDLNEESRKAERETELKALEWNSDVSSAKRELNFMKGELSAIKEKISEVKERFTGIVNELRLASSQEDMEKLKKRIDELEFGNLMAREDFRELISKKQRP